MDDQARTRHGRSGSQPVHDADGVVPLLLRAPWQAVQALGLWLTLGFGGALLAFVGFLLIADSVTDNASTNLDRAVLAWVHSFASPSLDVVAWLASALGSEAVWGILVGLVIAFAAQRRWGTVGALVTTVLGAELFNTLLKAYFERARPNPLESFIPAQAYSFPSGHAMGSAAFYTVIAYLGWVFLRHSWRIWWVASISLLLIAVAWSRLYLGVHYLTDVVAGVLAGFVWAYSVLATYTLLRRRATRHRQGRQLARSVPPSTIGAQGPLGDSRAHGGGRHAH